jgi:anaerobic selenocysteine-containing dehydrogenase
MMRKGSVSRRNFLKGSVAGAASLGLGSAIFSPERLLAEVGSMTPVAQNLLSQCPYCGVGCGTVIKADKTGRILGVVPDKQHSTNKGVQCIKGLNADEPTYVDRLDKVLVRKDMSDPMKGYESGTKGGFDDDMFDEVSYEEAEDLVAHKVAEIYKAHGGNSIGLYGSGQLTVEAQWMENKLMKGILESNSIEANARTCMTSAVTAYFATLGSDTPPLSYEDIEQSDMITMWGHNARSAHTIIFWRVADHKKKNGIVTVVADPRRTGTVSALESINPRNSYHFQTINGDISILNAIAHVIITEYPDAVDYEFLKAHTSGWEEYIKVMKAEYSPEQVVDRTMVEPSVIREVAKAWVAASKKGKARGKGGVLSFWGIGYNQHIHGQHNVISIINLHRTTAVQYRSQ